MIKTLQKLKLSKTVLLTILAVAVVIGLLTFGVVQEVRSSRLEAAEATQAREQQIAKDRAVEARIQALEAQVTTSETQRKQVCDYVTNLSRTGVTRFYVTVPTQPCL